MKRITFSFFTMLAIILFATTLWGQEEKKNNLTISGILARYISIEDQEYDWDRHEGYHRGPSPGVELVYMRSLGNSFELGTGINYQLGFVSSYINNHERRFKFNDICVPVLLKRNFRIKKHENWYATTGLYFGKTKNINAEYPTSPGFRPVSDITSTDYYSDDCKYSDLYLDFGYHTSLQKTGVFSFAPFFKYRINSTWLNYHQNKFHFGIKINYSIKF